MASLASRSADRAAPSGQSLEHQFFGIEGGEVPLEVCISDVRERRWLPAWRIVLVDDHRTHAFVKIVTVHDARYDPEFSPHAVLERPVLAAAHLRERDLEA